MGAAEIGASTAMSAVPHALFGGGKPRALLGCGSPRALFGGGKPRALFGGAKPRALLGTPRALCGGGGKRTDLCTEVRGVEAGGGIAAKRGTTVGLALKASETSASGDASGVALQTVDASRLGGGEDG